MASALELSIRRYNTRSYIEASPTEVVLTPRNEQLVGGTKKFVAGTPRAAQQFRVIWAYDNGVYRQLGDQGGARRFDFIIVGEHDAEVAIGDFWKVGSQEFRVEYIFPRNGYEVKAGGISHGAEPG